jgi:hypothetical protein
MCITGGHCDNNLLLFEYHATEEGVVADGSTRNKSGLSLQLKRPARELALARCGNRSYFLGAIASLVAFATRNFTTVLALI